MTKIIRRIGLLLGGISAERDVSLRSGKNVHNALLELGYDVVLIDPKTDDIPENVDFVYNALHGKGGEDGVIQGVLESMGIAYSGPGVLACAVCMDKRMTKYILVANDVPTPMFAWVTALKDCAALTIPYPRIIKPCNEGSSMGVEIVDTEVEMIDSVNRGLLQYGTLLVEQLVIGKEVTVGLIGNQPIVLPILELIPKNRFYDFEAKYTPGMTEFVLPARLNSETQKKVNDYAKKAFHVLGCKGVSRIDFIIDKNNQPMMIEVNTSPGMTDQSDLPAQAKAYGFSFSQLVQEIITGSL